MKIRSDSITIYHRQRLLVLHGSNPIRGNPDIVGCGDFHTRCIEILTRYKPPLLFGMVRKTRWYLLSRALCRRANSGNTLIYREFACVFLPRTFELATRRMW
jgi:hypothetical protein